MPYTNLKMPIIAILVVLALLQIVNVISTMMEELLYVFLAKALVCTLYISFYYLVRELVFFESILFDSEETNLFISSQEENDQRVKDAVSDSTSSSGTR